MVDSALLERLADALPENGELPYSDRFELRRALAAESPEALLRLEASCARRAIPIWTAAFPDDTLPIDVMNAALSEPDNEDLESELGELKTYLDNVFDYGDDYFTANYAGSACWAVARDALGDVTEEPDGDGELQIPPDEWSPCFFASIAEAGGAVWEDVADDAKRREFWRWYLLEALPAAQA